MGVGRGHHRVGIGTTAPSSKLHVNGGDIRVSSGSFIDDGTTLLHVTTCTSQAVTAGNQINVPAWDVEFLDVTASGDANAVTFTASLTDAALLAPSFPGAVSATGTLSFAEGTPTVTADITGPGGLFTEKRSPDRAEQEVDNAIRAGFATAMKQYSVTQLFSPQGASFDQTVRDQIQARLGDQTEIKNVFVTDLLPPQAIAEQRVAAAQQELQLKQALDQLKIDSAQATGRILKAEAAARETQLNAQALASSPEAIRIRIAEVTARGLSDALRACTSNCFIGGDVMERAMVMTRPQ